MRSLNYMHAQHSTQPELVQFRTVNRPYVNSTKCIDSVSLHTHTHARTHTHSMACDMCADMLVSSNYFTWIFHGIYNFPDIDKKRRLVFRLYSMCVSVNVYVSLFCSFWSPSQCALQVCTIVR